MENSARVDSDTSGNNGRPADQTLQGVTVCGANLRFPAPNKLAGRLLYRGQQRSTPTLGSDIHPFPPTGGSGLPTRLYGLTSPSRRWPRRRSEFAYVGGVHSTPSPCQTISKAEDTRLGRFVALKFLHPLAADGQETMAFTKDELVIFAARSGNVTALSKRVRDGGNINYFDSRHGAPLIAAIRNERIAAIEWLLANGVDVNASYGDQIGPLEVALYRPNLEVVGLLLSAGARLRKKVRPFYAVRLKNCLKSLASLRSQRTPHV